MDFVLHAPGRDFDVVELSELDFEEVTEEEAEEPPGFDEDYDEDEVVTGVWQAAAPRPLHPVYDPGSMLTGETPWWKAARGGLRAQPSKPPPSRELAWWEAARNGVRAINDE